MANTYESKFKGVEIDDGVNIATYATGTGGINVTIKGTTNVTGTGGRHLEIDGSGKQDKITDQTSLGVGGLKVTGITQLYQKTGWSGAPLVVSSNNGDFIEAYNGSSYTQIDMLDGNYTNIVFLPTGDGTLATTADITSAINGQSFKTINGESIKGTGDISITAGTTGTGIDTLSDINLTLGDTTVQYSLADGITLNSTARMTYNGTETHDATMKLELPLMVAPITGSPLTMSKGYSSENVYIGWNTGAKIKAGSLDITGDAFIGGQLSCNDTSGSRLLLQIGYPEGAYFVYGPQTAPYHTGTTVYLPDGGGTLATTYDLDNYTKSAAGTITVSGSTGMNYLNNTIAGGYYANNIALPGNTGTGGVDIPRGSWIIFRTSSISNPAVFIASGRLAVDTNKKHMYFAVKVDNTYYGWYELAQTSDIPAAGITGVNIYSGGKRGTITNITFDSDIYNTPTIGGPTGGAQDWLIMPTPKTKTINGQSILGSGDITIGGGSAGVSSIGGKTGAITLGEGLSMNGNELSAEGGGGTTYYQHLLRSKYTHGSVGCDYQFYMTVISTQSSEAGGLTDLVLHSANITVGIDAAQRGAPQDYAGFVPAIMIENPDDLANSMIFFVDTINNRSYAVAVEDTEFISDSVETL